jgi:hypothetical protein
MKAFLLVLTSLFLVANADATNLLKPTNKVESWRLEQVDGGKAEIKADDESVSVLVSAVDSTNWHVQLVQSDLDLKDGVTYTLKFKARSPESVSISINAMIDQEDWHEIGLHEDLYLTKEYKDYSYDFTANGTTSKKNRISFVLGNDKGLTQIKDVTLVAK